MHIHSVRYSLFSLTSVFTEQGVVTKAGADDAFDIKDFIQKTA